MLFRVEFDGFSVGPDGLLILFIGKGGVSLLFPILGRLLNVHHLIIKKEFKVGLFK